MEDKLNPAVDNPVAATDVATSDSSSQAPSAAAEQGVSTATAQDTASETPSTDVSTEAQSEQQEEKRRPFGIVAAVGAAVVGAAAVGAAAFAATRGRQEEEYEGIDAVSPDEYDFDDDDDVMTMEDVMAASDEQMGRKPIHRGMLTTGTIIMLAQDGVVVDVGAKIEGLIPYNQLFEMEVKPEDAQRYFKPGDDVQVYVIRADIPNNTIILSKKRADQERAWNLLQDIHEHKKPVEVEIVEKVRGGLVANLGVRAFLPASQVDVRRVNDLSPYVGKRMKVRIIELNRKRNRVIISRRSILEEEISERKSETLQKLEPGATLEGEVVEITDFGVFVNLGGIDGLVHRSEISHGRFNHPREVLAVGDKVKVEVLDMDLERERINLSMKKLISDPWEQVLTNYVIGQKVGGKVTNLTPFGAFVEIEPGLEGLIHVSEMSWTKRVRHPKEVVQEGQDVEAMILKIDLGQKRISLGLRQTQPDPWSSLPDRFPPGTEVTGPITGITDFGVFMEIEEGIEGLIHISELAHEHIEDIGEHFKRGDEVTAVILNIDPVEQRASLSRKRLMPFTAGEGGDYETAAARDGGAKGQRKGRRGGRRSAGIDYDYSYAASEAGTKTTTKLGDVYADLFAQFGLAATEPATKGEGDSKAEKPQTEAAAPATEASNADASATEASNADASEAPAAQAPVAEAPAAPAAQAPAAPQTEAAQGNEGEEVDPENVIDAAEAAALLTAAFRQGKRPAGDTKPEAEKVPEEEKVEENVED